ncbi:clavesin-1-like [Rhodnius prolixus]|uniref:clavesin-1-like n=1 Tax=Rhodnius prolixus TaxID=13249 RepID=UPI003D18B469
MADNEVQLSPELEKLAKADLREDETLRKQVLTQMREWLEKSSEITNCRTDAQFLLRFLRTKKYSLPLAQEMLERYLAIRQLYPDWFKKLDVDDPKMLELIDLGYCVALPERDEFGRKVIFTCTGKFDASKYTSTDMVRIHSLILESYMDDHENQIRGYTQIYDESGLSMNHLAIWSLTDIRNIIKCIQNSVPMRHKSTHFLNLPTSANKIFEFFLALLNEKLKNRVMVHKSIDDLKKQINPDILPKEYGGKVPLADMIENMKKELRSRKEILLSLDNMEIDLTKKTKLVDDLEESVSGVAGSFRKLEVD